MCYNENNYSFFVTAICIVSHLVRNLLTARDLNDKLVGERGDSRRCVNVEAMSETELADLVETPRVQLAVLGDGGAERVAAGELLDALAVEEWNRNRHELEFGVKVAKVVVRLDRLFRFLHRTSCVKYRLRAINVTIEIYFKHTEVGHRRHFDDLACVKTGQLDADAECLDLLLLAHLVQAAPSEHFAALGQHETVLRAGGDLHDNLVLQTVDARRLGDVLAMSVAELALFAATPRVHVAHVRERNRKLLAALHVDDALALQLLDDRRLNCVIEIIINTQLTKL
jgi:hypothetical protein